MTSHFLVKEHIIDASHGREYARATSLSQEEVLKLAVKQYTPRDNLRPQAGDVTIVGAHANGFPKEMYEALWDDIYIESKKHGFKIRDIWILDVAWQGQSGILNEDKLGNDPSWMDYVRDIYQMISHFRMPRPLIGIAHSFGATSLTNVALMHPRLFTTLILLDPTMSKFAANAGAMSKGPVLASLYRRDIWPSREEAQKAFLKSPYYSAWDSRVFKSWMDFGIRTTPTKLYPNESGAVTLTTTKHHEVFTFVRPSWDAFDAEGKKIIDRSKVPDLDLNLDNRYPQWPVYRSEGPMTNAKLQFLRPSVLYFFGGTSNVSPPELRKEKMENTGVGQGGSGGAAAGRVKEILFEESGHLFPMEIPQDCARLATPWIAKELEGWRKEQDEYEAWTRKSQAEKTTLDREWTRRLVKPPKTLKESKM